MTKRKPSSTDLELNFYRLRKIAHDLYRERPLDDEQRGFVIQAFTAIGNGADANAALGVKARRGQRRSKGEIAKRDKTTIVMAFIATSVANGKSVEDAAVIAAETWGCEYEYLFRLWRENPEYREKVIDRPLSSFP
jgi:hypothetical protein